MAIVFSSPELKAQVSFSDHLSSVVCLSVRPSVCLSVNCSHFHLLLHNHWANFNQTWHKVFLGEWDSSLFKWRTKPWANSNQTWHKAFLDKRIQVCSNEGPRSFLWGDNYGMVKKHWRNKKKKTSSTETLSQFQPNLPQGIPGWRGFNFKGEIIMKSWKCIVEIKNIFFCRTLSQFRSNLAQSIFGRRGFKFVQMKGHTLFQGEIITK